MTSINFNVFDRIFFLDFKSEKYPTISRIICIVAVWHLLSATGTYKCHLAKMALIQHLFWPLALIFWFGTFFFTLGTFFSKKRQFFLREKELFSNRQFFLKERAIFSKRKGNFSKRQLFLKCEKAIFSYIYIYRITNAHVGLSLT